MLAAKGLATPLNASVMRDEREINAYDYVTNILRDGSDADFERLISLVEEFPNGTDGFLKRRWILHGIDVGSVRAVAWMIHKRVDLSFVDDEGYSPVLTAIESRCPAKYEILKLLLKHGAPTDVHGVNDWTPLHLAAARNDVESLKILVKFGADITARTRIDDYATPLEEARTLGCEEAVTFLKGVA